MHYDLNLLPAGNPAKRAFCIIGAGIAGLVLSQRLAKEGVEVTLLEAGGLEIEESSQQLYAAEMADQEHTGTMQGRFRAFGGSSTRWGGQLLPYPEDVFTPVPGSPSIRWPIDGKELGQYREEIERIMHVGSLPYTDALLGVVGLKRPALSIDIRLRYSKWAPFSKRNLGQTIGQDCLRDPLIHLVTHANVAELVEKDGRIIHARVVDYNKRSFEFSAECFIVAAGTIESSRIVLSSKTLTNRWDQFGRYFHDHVSFSAATLPRETRKNVMKRLGPFFIDGVLHTCKLEAISELQRDEKLASVMAHFVVDEPKDSGVAAVRNMLTSIQQGNLKEAVTANFKPMVFGMGEVAELAWATKILKRRSVSKRATVRLNIDMEQPADPQNRIRLSDSVDRLGLPKAVVDWRIGQREMDTGVRFARIIKSRLEDAGFPPLRWADGLFEGAAPKMLDTYHAMGGLRMGTDPKTSVVDTNLKVHDVANLHIASCAVYPAGGSSNPTYTLMALTMRLADHLTQTA